MACAVERLLGFARLLRPGNAAMASAGVLLGGLVAVSPRAVEGWSALLLAAGATMLATAAGNALNDLTDLEIDRAAHPDRPLPAGDLSPAVAWGVVGLGILVALLLGGLVSAWVALYVLVATLLLVAYELALKRRGLVGNVVVGVLVAATFPLGALAVDAWHPAVGFLAGAALSANVARELWKDGEDAAHDAGRRTVARTLGSGASHRLAQIATVVALVLSPLPLLTGFGGWPFLVLIVITDGLFLWALATRDPGQAQRRSKLAMLGAMVAFAVGALA